MPNNSGTIAQNFGAWKAEFSSLEIDVKALLGS